MPIENNWCGIKLTVYFYTMNYLAHAYLSFNEPEILIGNLISDFVKGKKKFSYSPGIQNGIAIHRAIDQFTDDHAATHAAKLFFKEISNTNKKNAGIIRISCTISLLLRKI